MKILCSFNRKTPSSSDKIATIAASTENQTPKMLLKGAWQGSRSCVARLCSTNWCLHCSWLPKLLTRREHKPQPRTQQINQLSCSKCSLLSLLFWPLKNNFGQAGIHHLLTSDNDLKTNRRLLLPLMNCVFSRKQQPGSCFSC